jgi:hypothetical protein
MEAMREAWTDERLDDFNRKVDEGLDGLETRFGALQRTLILTNTILVAALIGLIGTQL